MKQNKESSVKTPVHQPVTYEYVVNQNKEHHGDRRDHSEKHTKETIRTVFSVLSFIVQLSILSVYVAHYYLGI